MYTIGFLSPGTALAHILNWTKMKSHYTYQIALGLLILSLAVPCAFAQDTIITDRPDFTESGVSVPRGKIQIEGGFGVVDLGNSSVLSLPETLVRIGLQHGFELRIGVPNYEDGNSASGIGDVSIGAKLEIKDLLDGWQTAVIATLQLPTGEEEIGSDHVSAEVILAGGKDLNEVYSFGTQIFAGLSGSDDGTDAEVGGTVVVSRPVTESLSSFLELATSIQDTGDTELLLHGGMVYLIQHNLQIDVHLAVGLTDESPDTIFGAGLSIIL